MIKYLLELLQLMMTTNNEYVTYIPTYQLHISKGNGRTNCGLRINKAQWIIDDLSEDTSDGNIFVCSNCVSAIHPTILNVYLNMEGHIRS